MTSLTKLRVAVAGASGETGQSIMDGILADQARFVRDVFGGRRDHRIYVGRDVVADAMICTRYANLKAAL